jgi:hypothetical protein
VDVEREQLAPKLPSRIIDFDEIQIVLLLDT